jgi:hypothetical protein
MHLYSEILGPIVLKNDNRAANFEKCPRLFQIFTILISNPNNPKVQHPVGRGVQKEVNLIFIRIDSGYDSCTIVICRFATI